MKTYFPQIFIALLATALVTACTTVDTTPNANRSNANMNANANTNANANANTNTNTAAVTVSEAAEPEEYQATVKVSFEAIGDTKRTTFPTLSAEVAKSGDDRRMVFTMPAGGRVVFLDKAGTNYLVLPDRNQYAELNRESLGFEVRRLLMPGQIVDQVRTVEGVERVGEEKYNGRDAIKYRYMAVTKTDTAAGDVSTESYLYVDKATGLPLRSETVSRAPTGQDVQGYEGLRIVTEMTDLKTDAADDLFSEPTSLQKVESSQIRSQVDMVFSAVASMLTQMMNRSGTTAPAANASPAR